MAGGDTREEALSSVQDVLVTALACYFKDRREIPFPSAQGEGFVQIPASVAAKILLLNAVVQQGISNADLARLTGTRPQEVMRMLDLHHPTKIDTIQAALKTPGRQLELTVA